MQCTSLLWALFAIVIDKLFGFQCSGRVRINLVHVNLSACSHVTSPMHGRCVLRNLHRCWNLVASSCVELTVHDLVVVDQGRSWRIHIQIFHAWDGHAAWRMEKGATEILALRSWHLSSTGRLIFTFGVLGARSGSLARCCRSCSRCVLILVCSIAWVKPASSRWCASLHLWRLVGLRVGDTCVGDWLGRFRITHHWNGRFVIRIRLAIEKLHACLVLDRRVVVRDALLGDVACLLLLNDKLLIL